MFGTSRRHRPPTQPLTRETANPNAATAAASAFARREPSASLSSAAAAAALKARPTTPTNVAQVQSKRATRRSASVSSTGSRERGRREIHRSPSNSSMTERTFRSPSPGRGAAPRSHDGEVPPVPALPNNEQYQTGATSTKHKRATSLQIQPFRTASQKAKEGQGSWFGAARTGDLSNIRHSDAVLENRPSSERPSSPSSSINFSYPRSKHDAALALSGATVGDRTLVYDANSRRMVPRSELLGLEQTIRSASEKPVKKKKYVTSRGGSHLSKGSVSRTKGTAVETPASPPDTHSHEAGIVAMHARDEEQHEAPQVESAVVQESTPITKDEELQSDSDSGLESDSDAEDEDLHKGIQETSVPTSQLTDAQMSVIQEQEKLQSQYQPQQQAAPQNQEIPVPANVPARSSPPNAIPPDNVPSQSQDRAPRVPAQTAVEKPMAAIQRVRVHSESPARTPHFATAPDQLRVRHEPPPRSLSPRKSAMKQRSPTRNASPSEDGSEASSALMGSLTQDDASISRRKSIRVSFDDQNTMVVGESAEPIEPESQLPSPQNKKAWHSIIGRSKRDSMNLDDDEKMTPRPALPSFGSIREKKTKELEERPLVRPSERPGAPPLSPPTSPPSEDLGQSSDMAIGSLLAQDQSSRNAANISRYREPLPPVVTSVDSIGHISNSSDDESELDTSLVDEPSQTMETQTTMNESPPKSEPIGTQETGSDESIPRISISHPSPRVPDDDHPDSPETFFDLPGGFPGDDSPTTSEESRVLPADDTEKSSSGVTHDASSSTKSSKKLPPISTTRAEPVVASPPSPLIHDIKEEEEESEGDSIYSDAYEDLSDMEGDGFMSLDAIVDSPVTKLSQKLPEKIIAKSKEANAGKDTAQITGSTENPLQTKDDWENAKTYWKSLSAEKRRQLEKEAMEEAGEDADLDDVVRAPKKAKKRASLDKPQQKMVSEKARDSERVYQIQPGTSWPVSEDSTPSARGEKAPAAGGTKLRKSLRGAEPAAKGTLVKADQSGGMRKSMRSSAAPTAKPQEGHFRKSMRSESETATNAGVRAPNVSNGSATRKAQRPVSYQPPSTTEPLRHQRRNLSTNQVPSPVTASTTTKPSLRRRGSDSSESSFRRARVGGEGLGFKKTMRGSARDSATFSDGGRGSGRFSLRSLSPAGSSFRNAGTVSPTPMPMSGRMRNSMRSNSSDNGSARRVSGFGRSTGKKGKKTGSRFADSSDEEDAQPSYRSRFADSSDEDEAPSPVAKRNGMPKSMRSKTSGSAAAAAMSMPQTREEEEDSPDLPDSEDEMDQPASSVAVTQSPGSQVSGAPRPKHTRRGSFMSILRRKKDAGGKISRPLSESAARRDTPLERSTEELAAIRNTGTQQSGRLHKRDRNWPLGDGQVHSQHDEAFDDDESNTYVNEDKRPSTASGAGSSLPISPVKQGFLKRRSTSQSALGGLSHGHDLLTSVPDARGVETDAPDVQKKKKFGTLRKMFRLND